MNCKFCGAKRSATVIAGGALRFRCHTELYNGEFEQSWMCVTRELARIKSERDSWRDIATTLYEFLPRECSHESGEACDVCAAEAAYNNLKNPTK